jgi:hypothetical protein
VLSELGKVDRTILQLSFCDNESQLSLLLPERYRAFGLNTTLMATSTNHVSQPSDMSSVQSPLLHSVKLEIPNNLVNLSSDSFAGAIPNISLPTPLNTPLLAIPSAMSTQSLSSLLLVHLVIPTSLGHRATPILVSIPMSWSALDTWLHFLDPETNELLLTMTKLLITKCSTLPPSYNGNVIFELPPSHVIAFNSKNTMDSMDKWFDGHTWCRTITSNIHNSQGLTFRKSSYIGQLVCNNQNCDFFSRSSKRNETK